MTVSELAIKLKAAEELAGAEAEVRVAQEDGTPNTMVGSWHVHRLTVNRDGVVDLHLAPWRSR